MTDLDRMLQADDVRATLDSVNELADRITDLVIAYKREG